MPRTRRIIFQCSLKRRIDPDCDDRASLRQCFEQLLPSFLCQVGAVHRHIYPGCSGFRHTPHQFPPYPDIPARHHFLPIIFLPDHVRTDAHCILEHRFCICSLPCPWKTDQNVYSFHVSAWNMVLRKVLNGKSSRGDSLSPLSRVSKRTFTSNFSRNRT